MKPGRPKRQFDGCERCGDTLPPLNGIEENDFAIFCEQCREEMSCDDSHEIEHYVGLDQDWCESEDSQP